MDGRFENWGTYNNSLYLAKNMNQYLSADIICSKMRTVFRKRSLRKTVSIEDQIMSKDKYPDTFLRQIGDIVLLFCKYFATRVKKCLRTAHCRQHGRFSFECSLVQNLWKKISPFFCNNHKTFPHLELKFKRRIIVSDVRFENWELSLSK